MFSLVDNVKTVQLYKKLHCRKIHSTYTNFEFHSIKLKNHTNSKIPATIFGSGTLPGKHDSKSMENIIIPSRISCTFTGIDVYSTAQRCWRNDVSETPALFRSSMLNMSSAFLRFGLKNLFIKLFLLLSIEPVGRKSSSPENDSSIGLPFFKPFIPCFKIIAKY